MKGERDFCDYDIYEEKTFFHDQKTFQLFAKDREINGERNFSPSNTSNFPVIPMNISKNQKEEKIVIIKNSENVDNVNKLNKDTNKVDVKIIETMTIFDSNDFLFFLIF